MAHVSDATLLTAQQTAAAAAAEAILNATPGSSKARQKKFHRHFKQVSPDERVLNCKLICLVCKCDIINYNVPFTVDYDEV